MIELFYSNDLQPWKLIGTKHWFGTPTWPPFHRFGTPGNMADLKSCEKAVFLSEAAEYYREVNVVYICLSQEFKRIVISQA